MRLCRILFSLRKEGTQFTAASTSVWQARLSPGNAAKLYSLVETQGVANTKVSVTGHINSIHLRPSRYFPSCSSAFVRLGPALLVARLTAPLLLPVFFAS
jgi:hypothetical protein